MNIDYKKLNDRIVDQAYKSSTFILDEEQKHQLIQGKIERARIQQAAFQKLSELV